MTYDDALRFLDSLTNYERTHDPQAMRQVSLERMRRLCGRLGDPQQRFRSILVAGTNGKGSICAMLDAILRAAGFRVGLYTSPHLTDPRERIRVSEGGTGGEAGWISQEAFAAVIGRLQPAIESGRSDPDGPLTYFETLTAAAWLHFAQQGVHLAVLEVGLGGRCDATNVAEPAVSVIGPIGFDHADVLGPDLLSIAREKAAIMRPGRPVVSAQQPPEVAALLRELAAQHESPLIEYGQAVSADVITHDPLGGVCVSVQGTRSRYEALQIPLLGRHQAQNAALAIAAVEWLSREGSPFAAIRAGLGQVSWPGRLELVWDSPLVLLDGAHNPPAARALRETLDEFWPDRPVSLLLGMSRDKAVREVGEILAGRAETIVCTQSAHPRACNPKRLAAQLKGLPSTVVAIPDAVDACTYLLNTADPARLIVVTGSLFLVGQLRAALKRAEAQHGVIVAGLSQS
ncbi:MAG: bifunctional folylpolyglutamate synthase/dihydrofolate synthase [Candidatus Omnitrophica bacterium]|nr:bifunctional folylpolyglutamate synthase/dihydrofolate synthase [Candidatus Omnitrophota bacterium]